MCHARNFILRAPKMTCSSIEPYRLCRSAAVTRCQYRACLYLVTIHFCEHIRYSKLCKWAGHRPQKSAYHIILAGRSPVNHRCGSLLTTSDGEKGAGCCVRVIGSLDTQGYTITLENICPRVCLVPPPPLHRPAQVRWDAAEWTVVIVWTRSVTCNF